MTLGLPADAMLVLIGPSGAGKSTFAGRHFAASEVLSSDAFRAMVADDSNDQSATDAAFELLHAALALRLSRGRLTVVDATNVEEWARRRLMAEALRHRRPAVAIVFALPLALCLERNAARTDRRLPPATIRRQHAGMRASVVGLGAEGFGHVASLSSADEVEAVRVRRQPAVARQAP